MTDALQERFWSKVDKNGPTMPHMVSNCWVWTGLKSLSGYGRIYVKGRMERAHRLSLSFELGRMPKQYALHACDNPSCVRPDHLREGSHSENELEAYSRGLKKGRKGEKHHKSKLTSDDVLAIRQRAANGETLTGLARTYGVTVSTVHGVVKRNTWKHVA